MVMSDQEHIAMLERLVENETDRNDVLDGKMHQIQTWCDAYPLAVFPEPDFKKAADTLKKEGMTLDAIAASNMRHVLRGITAIIDSPLSKRG